MDQSINAQLEELIRGSQSFSKQEKEVFIHQIPSMTEAEMQDKIRILLQEKEQREENRKKYIDSIMEINKKYGSDIDPQEEIRKVDEHLMHTLEYQSTVALVQENEKTSKLDDNHELENILQNI